MLDTLIQDHVTRTPAVTLAPRVLYCPPSIMSRLKIMFILITCVSVHLVKNSIIRLEVASQRMILSFATVLVALQIACG